MSKVLSGDEMTEYKRWQVPDVGLGEGREGHTGGNKYLTAVQLEKIQKQAYDEAYARGLKEGKAAGQSHIQEKAQLFITLANALQQPIVETDERVESEISLLCLAIAKQIIRREITLDSGHIISVIREALAALPVSAQKVRISLHPDDGAMVRKVMSDLNEDISFTIVDDITLSKGGCKVVTENSQIDATLETRIAMIASKILVDERSRDDVE